MKTECDIPMLTEAEQEALRAALATPQQGLVIGLMRAHDELQYRAGQMFKRYGLSQPQYNILRILRGEGKPLPCLEVSNRLITRVPAITSLVDKLEGRGLVVRKRCDKDRRVWYVALTKPGLDLLAEMDEPIQKFHQEICNGLSDAECQTLAGLLAKIQGPA